MNFKYKWVNISNDDDDEQCGGDYNPYGGVVYDAF